MADAILVIVFSLFMSFSILLCITGEAWDILSESDFQFWAILIASFTMAVAGGVLTDSLLYYSQLRNVRRLVILLLAVDILLLNVLYMLTHPSSAHWSVMFADRVRNRTITTTSGLAVMPAALLSSFAGDVPATLRNRILYGLWGGLVIPVFSLICFFSPTPLFVVTDPTGGLGGLTLQGWVVAILMPVAAVIAFVRFVVEYRKRRDRVVLAFGLALLLWATASAYLSLLWDPQQVAELIYMTDAMAGITVIGVAMVIDAFVEPFKTLEVEIEKRTEELEQSKRESELFLSAWGHKVGNLLQGITTYLDLSAHYPKAGEGAQGFQKEAIQLNWEAKIINRQVTWLSQVKSSSGLPLLPVDLGRAIAKAAESIGELMDGASVSLSPSNESVEVLADDNIDLLFTGLYSHCLLGVYRNKVKVSVSYRAEQMSVVVELVITDGPSPHDMVEFFKSKGLPDVVKLDLDMYMARLLLERYGASVEAGSGQKSALILRFVRPKW